MRFFSKPVLAQVNQQHQIQPGDMEESLDLKDFAQVDQQLQIHPENTEESLDLEDFI